jgi:hypothetical protein
MNEAAPSRAEDAAPTPRAGGWGWSLALGIAVAIIYLVNRVDPMELEDTIPAMLMPMSILRGDGPFLDRFAPTLMISGQRPVMPSIKFSHGHIVSRYSIGPAVISAPFVAVPLAIVDRIDPGWERNPGLTAVRAQRMSKMACACIAALTAVVLHRLLRRLGVGALAVPATLAAALGSDLWVVASQAPWEHGPAALMLTLSMLLLTPKPLGKISLLLAGTTTALMVCCRQIDVVFAVAMLLRVSWERPRALVWFLPAPVLLGSALIAYNLWFFDSIAGGHTETEALHPILHKVQGTWSGRLVDGMAGTLFSPNRGLFVFCPWVVVALVTLPAIAGRIRAWPLGIWLGGALVADLLILSKYSVWWAGHSFGPRYWTDAIPIFAVFLAFTLDWAWTRCRPWLVVCAASILISVIIQTIGAFCFPSSWCVNPINVDQAPERVWNWTDSELTRCLREGMHPWSKFKDPLWQR